MANNAPSFTQDIPSQLTDQRFKQKMFMLFFVPFLFFLIASLIHIVRLADEVKALNTMDVAITQSVAVSQVLHELQKERGMALVYLSSGGHSFEKKLRAQQQKTDQAFQKTNLLKIAPAHNNLFIDVSSIQRNVASLRHGVLQQKLSAHEVLKLFNYQNRRLIDAIGKAAIAQIDPELTRSFFALITFINFKELVGVERALLASTFTQDFFSDGSYQDFINVETEQRTYLKMFLEFANTSTKNQFGQAMASNLFSTVQRYRDIAHSRAERGVFGVDSTVWFDTMTIKIEKLRTLETLMAQNLVFRSSARCTLREQEQWMWFVGLMFIALLTGGAGVEIVKRINRSVSTQLHEYATLFENSAQAMLIINPHNKQVLFCNSQFLSWSGYQQLDINDLFIDQFIRLDDLQQTLVLHGQLVKGECSFIQECIFECADGQTKTGKISTFPIALKNKNYMVINIKDTNESTVTKKNFEKSQVALQMVIDHLDYAVSVIDNKSGEIIYLNGHAQDIFRDRNEAEPLWSHLSLQDNSLNPESFDNQYVQQILNRSNKRWYQISTKLIDWYDDRVVQFNQLEDITDKYDAENKHRNLLVEIRKLSLRNYTLQEHERKEIAGNLHDQFGQLVTGIMLQADYIKQSNKQQNTAVANSADSILKTTKTLVNSVRNITNQLRPVLLDQLGLNEALDELIGQWQEIKPDIVFSFNYQESPCDIPELVAISLYRIIQETLTNACKYADAQTIEVKLTFEIDKAHISHIILAINDDGIGFDSEAIHYSKLGLLNMRERAEALNGTFRLMSKMGAGVSTFVSIPLSEQQEGQ